MFCCPYYIVYEFECVKRTLRVLLKENEDKDLLGHGVGVFDSSKPFVFDYHLNSNFQNTYFTMM